MKVAVKVMKVAGQEWFVNAAFARPESPKLLTVLCSGEQGKTLTMVMSDHEFSNLEYHWFEDVGLADKQTAILPQVIAVGRAPK